MKIIPTHTHVGRYDMNKEKVKEPSFPIPIKAYCDSTISPKK